VPIRAISTDHCLNERTHTLNFKLSMRHIDSQLLVADVIRGPWSIKRLLPPEAHEDNLKEWLAATERVFDNVPVAAMAELACELTVEAASPQWILASAVLKKLAQMCQPAKGDGSTGGPPAEHCIVLLAVTAHLSSALQQRRQTSTSVASRAGRGQKRGADQCIGKERCDCEAQAAAQVFEFAWPLVIRSGCMLTVKEQLLALILEVCIPCKHMPSLLSGITKSVGVLSQAALTLQRTGEPSDGAGLPARWTFGSAAAHLCKAVPYHDGLLQLVVAAADTEAVVAFCHSLADSLRWADMAAKCKQETDGSVALLLRQVSQLQDTALAFLVITPDVLTLCTSCGNSTIRKAATSVVAKLYQGSVHCSRSTPSVPQMDAAARAAEVCRSWLQSALVHASQDRDVQIRKCTAQGVASQLTTHMLHIMCCHKSACLQHCKDIASLLLVETGETSVTVIAAKLQAQTDVANAVASQMMRVPPCFCIAWTLIACSCSHV
jgi:hypothetical protein